MTKEEEKILNKKEKVIDLQLDLEKAQRKLKKISN